jgi:hypothetical protein
MHGLARPNVAPEICRWRGAALLILRLAATITVATVSYTLVEQPIRSGRFLPGRQAARVLVLGDSVAETLFNGMPSYPQVQVTNRGVLGCGLLQETPYRYIGQVQQVPTVCRGWPDYWVRSVRESDPDVVAILVGRWEVMDRVIDGSWHTVGDPVFDRTVLADLNEVLPSLTARGKPTSHC